MIFTLFNDDERATTDADVCIVPDGPGCPADTECVLSMDVGQHGNEWEGENEFA